MIVMKVLFVLIPVVVAQPSPSPSGHGAFGKDTYAMSHPFAYKAFMEKYFPTAENVVEQNSTTDCIEWVKLCIDDGHMTSCQGPQGNFQMHAVGAYKRDAGAKSMEQLEMDFTKSMGDMTKYDPYFEYHMAFVTTDLDSYVSAFDNDKVPYFASTFESSGNSYKSILLQIPGSLAADAKSLINIEILGKTSLILEDRAGVHHHDQPRASEETLTKAHMRLASAPRKLSANGKPVLVRAHRSFASSDISRDAQYFESAMQGTKTQSTDSLYEGKMQSGDEATFRYVKTSGKTQGPTSVSDWEAYQTSLHKKCFDSANNQGFDRLADNHMGHNLGGVTIDAYVKGQHASGQPYRFYPGPMSGYFFYMYAPNGWGLQVIGSLSDSSLGPKGGAGSPYGFCTQGIKGHCSRDGSGEITV